jgi:hypothetical protein
MTDSPRNKNQFQKTENGVFQKAENVEMRIIPRPRIPGVQKKEIIQKEVRKEEVRKEEETEEEVLIPSREKEKVKVKTGAQENQLKPPLVPFESQSKITDEFIGEEPKESTKPSEEKVPKQPRSNIFGAIKEKFPKPQDNIFGAIDENLKGIGKKIQKALTGEKEEAIGVDLGKQIGQARPLLGRQEILGEQEQQEERGLAQRLAQGEQPALEQVKLGGQGGQEGQGRGLVELGLGTGERPAPQAQGGLVRPPALRQGGLLNVRPAPGLGEATALDQVVLGGRLGSGQPTLGQVGLLNGLGQGEQGRLGGGRPAPGLGGQPALGQVGLGGLLGAQPALGQVGLGGGLLGGQPALGLGGLGRQDLGGGGLGLGGLLQENKEDKKLRELGELLKNQLDKDKRLNLGKDFDIKDYFKGNLQKDEYRNLKDLLQQNKDFDISDVLRNNLPKNKLDDWKNKLELLKKEKKDDLNFEQLLKRNNQMEAKKPDLSNLESMLNKLAKKEREIAKSGSRVGGLDSLEMPAPPKPSIDKSEEIKLQKILEERISQEKDRIKKEQMMKVGEKVSELGEDEKEEGELDDQITNLIDKSKKSSSLVAPGASPSLGQLSTVAKAPETAVEPSSRLGMKVIPNIEKTEEDQQEEEEQLGQLEQLGRQQRAQDQGVLGSQGLGRLSSQTSSLTPSFSKTLSSSVLSPITSPSLTPISSPAPPAPTPATPIPSMVKTPQQQILVVEVECPPCGFPVPQQRRSLNEEARLLEKFSDQQLNIIGCDRNIPDVYVQPRQRKIQMILADPLRKEINPKSPLEDMTLGDLIYLAGREGVQVQRIPDRFNTRRILIALLQFQRNRCDLIQNNLLTDDDLRTIVYVLEACKDIPYAWTLERSELQRIMDTGKFPTCYDEFLVRWKRYETLNVLPHCFLQSLAFQIHCSELSMVPTEQYIISRIIDVPENPFEHIYAKERNMDIQTLKNHFGILVPLIWDGLDYLAMNGAYYPLKKQQEKFSCETLLTMGTRLERKKYISLYNDLEILSEVKNYVPYESRNELVENILNLFDETEYTYFVSLIPEYEGKIYYGNYLKSEVYPSIEVLAQKIDYLSAQQYPLEDRICVLKKIRQLQTLLLNRKMVNPVISSSISRLISNYEMTPDAYPFLNAFLNLPCEEILKIRKIFYQKFYYYQTRNSLFVPMERSEFLELLPKLHNVNQPNPNTCGMKEVQDAFQNQFYQTIAYMRLFFGYVPHSSRNI